MEEIKAIETEYNGYRFRSRLEARWAVFFDTLKIKYEYEPEGYKLKNGIYYLPDFYLPDLEYYAEVKGKNNHLYEDMKKVEQFVMEKKTAVIILSDIPYSIESKGLYWFPVYVYTAKYCRGYDAYYAFFMRDFIEDDFYIGCEKKCYIGDAEYNNDPMLNNIIRSSVFRKIQCIHGKDLDSEALYSDGFGSIRKDYEDELLPVQQAMLKARQARFEHGEKPII